jgi:pyridoxal phosphate enzyme (YggS family)
MKTYPVEDLLLLYELGVRDFGENRVQELAEKAPQLPDDVRFHMIGSLQSNKINALLPHVHMLQSLDRVSLAKALGKRLKKPLDTLLEINIADDANKQGMDPEEIPAVLAAVKPFPLLRVRGMMVMGSHTDDDSVIREDFKRANQLFASLKKEENEQVRMEILSMGMSGDYRIAAQEGASMIRVGSAILGERS